MTELLYILLTFALILFLLRKKIPLGYSLLIGSVTLALMARMSPSQILSTSYIALTESTAVTLLATVVLL